MSMATLPGPSGAWASRRTFTIMSAARSARVMLGASRMRRYSSGICCASMRLPDPARGGQGLLVPRVGSRIRR